MYAIEVCGCAHYSKYHSQIDQLISRAYNYGYISERKSITDIINSRDRKLWNRITSNTVNALQDLLPNKRSRLLRSRGHEYVSPRIRTERFKRSFINRCLFKFKRKIKLI